MKKPSVYIAMPCYDSVKIGTMISIIKLIQQLAKSGIAVGINTIRSPLIHQGRNYLTSLFLTTEYSHLLFIDSILYCILSCFLYFLNTTLSCILFYIL